jgi:hypothetical protein
MGVRRPPELMDFRLRHCSVQASSSVSATGRGSKGNGVLPCPCDTGPAGSGHLRAFCVVVTRPPENDDGQATGVIRSFSSRRGIPSYSSCTLYSYQTGSGPAMPKSQLC